MPDTSPRVSIGLPVWNGQKYIGEAIRSILSQSYTSFELLVSDNASTDRTLDIVRGYARQDARVRVLTSDQNRGAAWNFNRVVGEARGPLFKWAAHDDVLGPHFLHYALDTLDRDPAAVACHFQTARMGAEGEDLGLYTGQPSFDAVRPSVRFAQVVFKPHRCFAVFGVIRVGALRRTPMIGAYTGSDRNLLAELALHGKIVVRPEVQFARRDHPGASIRAHTDERERAAWFDPDLAGRRVYPTWRRLREYRASVRRAPISAVERARCRLQLARWIAGRHHSGERIAVMLMRDWRAANRDRPGT